MAWHVRITHATTTLTMTSNWSGRPVSCMHVLSTIIELNSICGKSCATLWHSCKEACDTSSLAIVNSVEPARPRSFAACPGMQPESLQDGTAVVTHPQKQAVRQLHDVGLVDGRHTLPVVEQRILKCVLRGPPRLLCRDDLQCNECTVLLSPGAS